MRLARPILVSFVFTFMAARGRRAYPLTTGTLAVGVTAFGIMLVDSFKYAGQLLIRIQVIEESRPLLP